jgi:hypothetical protein
MQHHIQDNDDEFEHVVEFYHLPENGGWNITLCCQPPNSPDFNILDLAMFPALQAIQQQHQTRHIDQLIEVVKKVYQDFPLQTSKKVWSTLQLVFDAVIKVKGRNNYKFPHTGKNRWLHENGEPLSLLLRYTEPTLQCPSHRSTNC